MAQGWKKELEELAGFIRAHRGSEGHFNALYEKLSEACKVAESNGSGQSSYTAGLKEALERHAETYKQQRDNGAGAWPEFEHLPAISKKLFSRRCMKDDSLRKLFQIPIFKNKTITDGLTTTANGLILSH